MPGTADGRGARRPERLEAVHFLVISKRPEFTPAGEIVPGQCEPYTAGWRLRLIEPRLFGVAFQPVKLRALDSVRILDEHVA